MRGIKKETKLRPRNRNHYLYVRSIGGEWLSRKIPGAALWISSARTAWRRRPRWIVCLSEPFLGDQKWRNPRERVLDCMEDDIEPPTWILLLAFSHVTCIRDPLAAGNELLRSCQNYSLLHTQRYCHRFAHSRLRLVSFWTPPARFFLNAPHTTAICFTSILSKRRSAGVKRGGEKQVRCQASWVLLLDHKGRLQGGSEVH